MKDHQSSGRPPIDGYTWGYNNAGGLGIGSVARVLRPVPVSLPADTVDVQGGTDFSAALTSTGQVFTWGGNRYGQLGDGATTVRFAPEPVELPRSVRVAAIAVGQDHVLALTRHGSVYAWGRNQHSQLGDGTNIDRANPVQLAMPPVAQVAAGNSASAAVTTDGSVLSWGRATVSRLGSRAVSGDPGVGTDLGTPRPLTLPSGVRAAIVDAGERHLVVLTVHGELLTFGVGVGGKPLPDSVPVDASWGKVISICAGDNHTVGLTDTGVVLAWGANYHGQLGTGDTLNRPTPVAVRIPKLRGQVTAVAAGGDSVLARTSGHQVYMWGHGGFGQQGGGDTGDQSRPHPVDIPGGATVTGIHTGRYHHLAITRPH